MAFPTYMPLRARGGEVPMSRVKTAAAATTATGNPGRTAAPRNGTASPVGWRFATSAAPAPADVRERRVHVARICKVMLGARLKLAGSASEAAPEAIAMVRRKMPDNLSPRMQQMLEHLVAGHSEKEIAVKLGLSVHTVHVHVKSLYKRMKVSSRGELFAEWLKVSEG